jgi:hypothetical protein
MSYRSRASWGLAGLLAIVAIIGPFENRSFGQGGLFRQSAVGGISIDASGVVQDPDVRSMRGLLEEMRAGVRPAEGDLNAPAEMRKISLRQLELAIQDSLEKGEPLSEEIQFLAGLQRIQYILVYPEQQDIVLAGPGEGWRVDEQANVVGITTGKPVLRLDDLLVALRTVHEAREVGITCSIDPTPEGIQRLQAVLDRQRALRSVNPAQLEPVMKEAMGPQVISLTGIPTDSHFARVLVSADYHMKRLAMNIDRAPISRFPSYLDLAKNSSEVGNSNPRWWMACNYETIARSEDGMAWELRGQGVKTLTEDNVFEEGGAIRARGGKTSPIAQKWADLMTERYEELGEKNVIFAELRNLMDLCVVAAIIEKYNLRSEADCQLSLLYDSQSPLEFEQWHAPKKIAPVCSFVRTRRGWVVTTSGGVQVDSWGVAAQTTTEVPLADLRDRAGPSGATWWWN